MPFKPYLSTVLCFTLSKEPQNFQINLWHPNKNLRSQFNVTTWLNDKKMLKMRTCHTSKLIVIPLILLTVFLFWQYGRSWPNTRLRFGKSFQGSILLNSKRCKIIDKITFCVKLDWLVVRKIFTCVINSIDYHCRIKGKLM